MLEAVLDPLSVEAQRIAPVLVLLATRSRRTSASASSSTRGGARIYRSNPITVAYPWAGQAPPRALLHPSEAQDTHRALDVPEMWLVTTTRRRTPR